MSLATADHVNDAIRGKLVLPMIPRVVRSALTLLRDPRTGSRELADVMSQDPVLCARVLRLANSPFYGGRRSVASIDDAVSVVGMQPLGTLLIAAGIKAAFTEVPGVNLRDFWMHSALAAASVRCLAQRARADREAAFLGGLLHESGHLILCMAFPDAAISHFAPERSRHGLALAEAETTAFGASHQDVSACWCRSLQLPDAVSDAVACCLAPAAGPAGQMAALLNLGACLAVAIGEGEGAEAALERLDANLAARAGLNLQALAADFDELYASLRQSDNIF